MSFFRQKVILLRFERRTYCLEGSCSIQLSYKTFVCGDLLLKSGWQDSNLRPPAPKAGAITGLRYIPYLFQFLRRRGDSNPRYPNRVRQFSKLLVSATHPPLRLSNSVKFLSKFRFAKVLFFYETTKFFSLFDFFYFFVA